MQNQINISKNGKIITVNIQYKKIKNTYLKYDNKSLLLTTNKFTSITDIEKYILSNFDKIYYKINNHKSIVLDLSIKPQILLIFNEKYNVEYTSTLTTRINQYNIVVDVNDYENQIIDIYLNRLQSFVNNEIPLLLDKLNINYPISISYKRMKSRYGSCNKRLHKINLNIYLTQYNKDFIRFVLAHELCHLIEPNHSKNFYMLLSSIMPNWKIYKKNKN